MKNRIVAPLILSAIAMPFAFGSVLAGDRVKAYELAESNIQAFFYLCKGFSPLRFPQIMSFRPSSQGPSSQTNPARRTIRGPTGNFLCPDPFLDQIL